MYSYIHYTCFFYIFIKLSMCSPFTNHIYVFHVAFPYSRGLVLPLNYMQCTFTIILCISTQLRSITTFTRPSLSWEYMQASSANHVCYIHVSIITLYIPSQLIITPSNSKTLLSLLQWAPTAQLSPITYATFMYACLSFNSA